MPGAVGIALAGLAASTWEEMWRLYRERYGRFGEEACHRLMREIEDLRDEIHDINGSLVISDERLKRERARADHNLLACLAATDRANELAARLNEAMCKIERADLPPNPYDEPGVPEPTEMDP